MIVDGSLQRFDLLFQLSCVDHFLSDQLRCRANASHCDEDVVIQEVAGHALHFAGERGREHHGLAWVVAAPSHVRALHYLPNLWLETHIKHTVCLIKDEELDKFQRNIGTVIHVLQAPRCGDQHVAASAQVLALFVHVSTTIDDATPDPSVKGKLAGLHMDLRRELSCRCQNKSTRCWLWPALAWQGPWRSSAQEVLQARDHESARLPTASLCTSH
mmetsp:Transcript_53274/g.105921  ORF Transcript_53274/g.105921 Transcript_53274/m.105921 type:complete len:216 (-) Transcript_53274:552-1199(-)